MTGVSARAAAWVDLGVVAPARLHAAYRAIARAMRPNDDPVVLWGRAGAHVSIGRLQDRVAEIVPDPGVPVIRRALGGGAVWIDERQWCWALIAPRTALPAPADGLIPATLRSAVSTMRDLGLPAEQCGPDVWVRGRKIAGSGAASIGAATVVASSFMLRFDAQRFAATIALPSEGLRAWLAEGLALTVTDWASEGCVPEPPMLERAFRAGLARTIGWQTIDSPAPACAVDDDEEPARDDDEWVGRPSGRLVEGGIRLNHASELHERIEHGQRWRTLVVNGRVVRRQADARSHH